MSINLPEDYAARFNISENEAETIAHIVNTEAEFITVWRDTDDWTDENQARRNRERSNYDD